VVVYFVFHQTIVSAFKKQLMVSNNWVEQLKFILYQYSSCAFPLNDRVLSQWAAAGIPTQQ
jgi:hypothetical protein